LERCDIKIHLKERSGRVGTAYIWLRIEHWLGPVVNTAMKSKVDLIGGEMLRHLNIIWLHGKVYVPRSYTQIVG
jgi:hypothetical protein